jgi:hypothetical protein
MDGIADAEACDIFVSEGVADLAAWCTGPELLHAASPSEITASGIRSVRITPTLWTRLRTDNPPDAAVTAW